MILATEKMHKILLIALVFQLKWHIITVIQEVLALPFLNLFLLCGKISIVKAAGTAHNVVIRLFICQAFDVGPSQGAAFQGVTTYPY